MSQYAKWTFVVDANNIVYSDRVSNVPSVRFLELTWSAIERDYPGGRIVTFADANFAGLRGFTSDDRRDAKRLVAQRRVLPVHTGRRADDYILDYCRATPHSVVVTSDKFRDEHLAPFRLNLPFLMPLYVYPNDISLGLPAKFLELHNGRTVPVPLEELRPISFFTTDAGSATSSEAHQEQAHDGERVNPAETEIKSPTCEGNDTSTRDDLPVAGATSGRAALAPRERCTDCGVLLLESDATSMCDLCMRYRHECSVCGRWDDDADLDYDTGRCDSCLVARVMPEGELVCEVCGDATPTLQAVYEEIPLELYPYYRGRNMWACYGCAKAIESMH